MGYQRGRRLVLARNRPKRAAFGIRGPVRPALPLTKLKADGKFRIGWLIKSSYRRAGLSAELISHTGLSVEWCACPVTSVAGRATGVAAPPGPGAVMFGASARGSPGVRRCGGTGAGGFCPVRCGRSPRPPHVTRHPPSFVPVAPAPRHLRTCGTRLRVSSLLRAAARSRRSGREGTQRTSYRGLAAVQV